jgi:hypothetical protein
MKIIDELCSGKLKTLDILLQLVFQFHKKALFEPEEYYEEFNSYTKVVFQKASHSLGEITIELQSKESESFINSLYQFLIQIASIRSDISMNHSFLYYGISVAFRFQSIIVLKEVYNETLKSTLETSISTTTNLPRLSTFVLQKDPASLVTKMNESDEDLLSFINFASKYNFFITSEILDINNRIRDDLLLLNKKYPALTTIETKQKLFR